jgi:hypothetical protein
MVRKPGTTSSQLNFTAIILQKTQEPVQHFRAGLKVQVHLLPWHPVLEHYVNQDGMRRHRHPILQGPEPIPGMIHDPDVRQARHAELQSAYTSFHVVTPSLLKFKIFAQPIKEGSLEIEPPSISI